MEVWKICQGVKNKKCFCRFLFDDLGYNKTVVLEKIAIESFRNYQKTSFEFSPKATLVVGPNTSGKTNLLEAIFLLALGRTFRPGLEREMIRWGEDLARVKGTIAAEGTELELVLTRGEVLGKPAPLKKLLVNGVSKRLFNFVGNLPVVLFSPEDLQLVTDSPSLRRSHLDFVLDQVDKEYRKRGQVYGRALSQRNRLLKLIGERRREKGELAYWDKLLIENGSYLTEKRDKLFDFINQLPQDLGEFLFVYQSSEINPDRLGEYRNQEIAAGMTLVGPHRDDWQFSINDRDLSLFGSRGEQRRAILALKLAELEFMDQATAKRPLLLLDDIFSELDEKNRQEVLKIIPRQQVVVTTTDRELVRKDFLDKIKVIELKSKS